MRPVGVPVRRVAFFASPSASPLKLSSSLLACLRSLQPVGRSFRFPISSQILIPASRPLREKTRSLEQSSALSGREEGRFVNSCLLLLHMETMTPPSYTSSHHRDASTCDVMSMQENLLFSDSLKDLKSLRSQLYSAAEYFEVFYRSNAEKPTTISSLKDYTIEALVSTVDHLGFVTYKVNDLLDEKADEVLETEFRVSSAEQRVRTCQTLIDSEGRSEQSLVIKAPKFHQHYILPGNTPVVPKHSQFPKSRQNHNTKSPPTVAPPVKGQSTIRILEVSRTRSRCPSPHNDSQQMRNPSPQKVRAPSASLQARSFSVKDKRDLAALPISNPLLRAASLSAGPAPAFASNIARLHSLDTQHPENLHSDWSDDSTNRNTKKSKGFLKALFSKRNQRTDESLYCYLDEY